MSIVVLSFNVRVITPVDGPDQWMHRRDAVGKMLSETAPDVMGLQEATRPQIDDIVARVKGYRWIGLPRTPEENAEFCPIFYRVDRLELLDHGNFWLAEAPDRCERAWGAGCVRIATWVKLRDRNGADFFLLNTHLDHESELARVEGAKLLRRAVPSLALALPAIVTGDFNCGPEAQAYRMMTEGEQGFRDARRCSKNIHEGPTDTFTGFRGNREPCLIDYIFCSEAVNVLASRTDSGVRDERQLSDHRPIVAIVEILRK